MKCLAHQGKRGHEHENLLAAELLGCPQRHQRLASAAGHEDRGAILFFECSHDGVEGVLLAGKRLLALVLHHSASEPVANCFKVLSLQPVQISSTDAVEPASFRHDLGQFIAVGDDHAFRDLIGQAHEGRKFIPGE